MATARGPGGGRTGQAGEGESSMSVRCGASCQTGAGGGAGGEGGRWVKKSIIEYTHWIEHSGGGGGDGGRGLWERQREPTLHK